MNRKLENVLVYDYLGYGLSPRYDLDKDDDVWYLGLAGELASEIKCSQLLLPMLCRETYNWEEKLRSAFLEAASLRPQRHVDTFAHAWQDLATHDKEACEAYTWFGNEETLNKLKEQVEFMSKAGYYKNEHHYAVARCGLMLDLPPKVIAITPEPEYFGLLSINDKFFNFLFRHNKIQAYYLRNLRIGPDA
jgi:hypothetical protein